MPVQGQTSPRGGNFRLARGDSMNKVIASASPAINAEGLDIWLLQVPELLVGFLIVVGTTGLAVLGLVVSRRFLPPEWLKQASGKDQLFALAGRLYTMMLAFTVVFGWQQFGQAEKTTWSEAGAIGVLIRDSAALPAAARPAVQQSLIAYTNDVANNEFPRMGRGELIAQQSDSLTRLWQSYLHVQPETASENAFYKESITTLGDLVSARKSRIASSEAAIPGAMWVLPLDGTRLEGLLHLGRARRSVAVACPLPDIAVGARIRRRCIRGAGGLHPCARHLVPSCAQVAQPLPRLSAGGSGLAVTLRDMTTVLELPRSSRPAVMGSAVIGIFEVISAACIPARPY